MANIVLDAGTTWSKIIENTSSSLMKNYADFLVKTENGFNYYVIPSSELKNIDFKFDKATGHMSMSMLNSKKDYENEVIALIYDRANDFAGNVTEVILNGEKMIIDLNGQRIRED